MEISPSQLLAQRLHLGDSIAMPPRQVEGGISKNEILQRLRGSRDTMEMLMSPPALGPASSKEPLAEREM